MKIKSASLSAWLWLAALALVLAWLFRDSFAPQNLLFMNDGTFGILSVQASIAWSNFVAYWQDLNWLGTQLPSGNPSPTAVMYAVAGPQLYAKFLAPAALFLLGACAWFCGRRLGLTQPAAFLLALAATLNANPFSYACWGLSTRAAALAAVFVALGCLLPPLGASGKPTDGLPGGPASPGHPILQWVQRRRFWILAVLAGIAVGINIMEAADVGALLSLYVAAFALWRCWLDTSLDAEGSRQTASNSQSVPVPAPVAKPSADTTSASEQAAQLRLKRVLRGIAVVLVVAGIAAWSASSALHSLVSTSIQGVSVLQESESPEARWNFITSWSFPKLETLRLVIPGVFGYRMDSPDGKAYWGAVGPDGNPASRFSGSGEYVGMWVLLLAAWVVGQSLRSQQPTLSPMERRLVGFWAVGALLSLLFAFGRFTPLYQLIYPLPLFNSMRLPMKFLHGFHLCVLMLFAHGLLALTRRLTTSPFAGNPNYGWGQTAILWWNQAARADRRWFLALGILTFLGILSGLFYAKSGDAVIRHLQSLRIHPVRAAEIAAHSRFEVLLALFWMVAFGALLFWAHTGWFQRRQNLFWSVAIGFVLLDMGRSVLPWIQHYDYQRRYQTNPVIEFLAKNPQEGRVAARLVPNSPPDMFLHPRDEIMPSVHNLWLEHHFQKNAIQTLDIIQMPRMPELDLQFLSLFTAPGADFKRIGRLWQLTNTRYILGASGLASQLDQAFAAPGHFFVPRLVFDLDIKPGMDASQAQSADDITAVGMTNGSYAIFEYTGALPRVQVFTQWETLDDEQIAARLVDAQWDPASAVLLSHSEGEPPPTSPPPAPNLAPGTTEARIVQYGPKHVVIEAETSQDGVLLFNDRWHPDWTVRVNGEPADLLLANWIMRGVYLPAGKHDVVFRFQPTATPLWISVSALFLGALLAGLLGWSESRKRSNLPTRDSAP